MWVSQNSLLGLLQQITPLLWLDKNPESSKCLNWQHSTILLIHFCSLCMRHDNLYRLETHIEHLWLRKCRHLLPPFRNMYCKMKKKLNLLCTRLLQMATLYIWWGGGLTDPQVHWYQGESAEGHLGARQVACTKVITQETAPKLKQILQISVFSLFIWKTTK